MPNHLAPPRSVVSRIAAILSTFLTGDTHSVTEMARLTGLPVSTTHRMACDLASWQLLVRNPDGRYRVGLTVQQIGNDGCSVPLLQERAQHVVIDLCEATGRRARLGVLRHGRVAYIEKQPGPGPVTSFTASATLPVHATALGKALLAFAPRATVASAAQHLTAYTPNTVDTTDRLDQTLGLVRLTRTAIACEELAAGDSAVAVPVFGGGEVVAALELEIRNLRDELDLAKATLTVAARGLSRELAVDPVRGGSRRLRLVAHPSVVGTDPVASHAAGS